MYALAYFVDENYEVIPTDWIEHVEDSFKDDMEEVEYVVNWRKGKNGKIIRCPATILAANVIAIMFFDFCSYSQENNYEVIPTDWIENVEDSFEDDMEEVEYVVNWRKGKSGKIIRCPATILAANVDRRKMVELANGATRSSLEKQKGRGKREKRRNPNYEAVEEEESVMV
ncbi:hypothetical protein KUCAC02_007096 [Chaenocephalus aceratus]|nr:hypothetical protein KUCAC02_007096 [Chaenocephalus aceratus]